MKQVTGWRVFRCKQRTDEAWKINRKKDVPMMKVLLDKMQLIVSHGYCGRQDAERFWAGAGLDNPSACSFNQLCSHGDIRRGGDTETHWEWRMGTNVERIAWGTASRKTGQGGRVGNPKSK